MRMTCFNTHNQNIISCYEMVIFFNTIVSFSIPGRDSLVKLNLTSYTFKYWGN